MDGNFYFHRDAVDGEPACTLCILRDKPGHWIIHAIVPDEGQPNPIPVQQYKRILSEFDALIAELAATSVQGLTAVEISEFRLEDYFSPAAVELLRRFCSTSNQSDLGTHPSDQEKWIVFLLRAYDDGMDIHCDLFGDCLRNAHWWPEIGISRLVREYDFALRFSNKLADKKANAKWEKVPGTDITRKQDCNIGFWHLFPSLLSTPTYR